MGETYVEEQEPFYDCLFFDLDDTLYPLSSGIAVECRKNIEEYMVEKLGIESAMVESLCTKFYKEHGTTLAGLVANGYNIDFEDYHSFVHGRLPYHVLKLDPVLRNLLQTMPERKLVFTNADIKHATKVLKRLGLEDCFEQIICFESMNSCPDSNSNGDDMDIQKEGVPSFAREVICKPSIKAMERAIGIAGVDPKKTLMFDDSVRNLGGAKQAGLHTVLVGNSVKVEGVDYAIASIHNIREAVPGIWCEDKAYPSEAHAMETVKVMA